MGLSLYEMETIVNMNREEDEMIVYTADPYLMKKLESYPAYEKIKEYRNEGRVIAADFRADKRLLTFRKERRTYTEEQKERFRENLAKANARD